MKDTDSITLTRAQLLRACGNAGVAHTVALRIMAYLPPLPAGSAAPAAAVQPSDANCTPAPWITWHGNIVVNEQEGQVCVCETDDDAELIVRLRNAAATPEQSDAQHVHSVDCFVEGTQVCGMDQRMEIKP